MKNDPTIERYADHWHKVYEKYQTVLNSDGWVYLGVKDQLVSYRVNRQGLCEYNLTGTWEPSTSFGPTHILNIEHSFITEEPVWE